MLQQINLYRQLKPTILVFVSFNTLLIFCGIFLSVLFLDSIYDYSHLRSLRRQASLLSAQLIVETDHLNRIKAEYPVVNLSDLETSMAHLRQELGEKGEILAILLQQPEFTNYLNAFASAIISGVWLTDIQISHFGREFALQGKTIKPALAQQFLRQLEKQPLFNKMELQLDEVIQVPATPQVAASINFVITAKTRVLQ